MKMLIPLMLLSSCMFKTPVIYTSECNWYAPINIKDSYEDEFIKNDLTSAESIAKNNLKYNTLCK